MATCGTCQREILWAVEEERGDVIAVDKLAGIGGVRTYSLDFDGPDPRPLAKRVLRPDVYAGHRLHIETCGTGTARL